MNFAEIFIKRPVMTTLTMAAILLFGGIGYRLLAVNDLPNVDFPTILVSATVPGASPETMASAVATPLERQFSTIAGLDSMNSSSALGMTQVTLQFSLARSIDAAAQDVQAAIATAAPQLPPGMPTPPSLRKVNPADQPVIYLAISSPTLPLYQVDEYAETLIAQRLSMVSGVAQVQVFGPQKFAVRIQLDPKALASRGIGIDEVMQAVQKSNVNLPTGTLYGKYHAFTVQSNGQLMNAQAYESLIVAYRNGAPIYLSCLGKVIDSVENDKVASWLDKTRAVVLAIQRQPGTNTVQVVDDIKKLFPSLLAQLPASVKLEVLYDRSVSIRNSVNDVQFSLLLALALVVMVIFLFLRNLSATVIPSLALPMSVVGTFAAMYLLGFSLNNLSLMALTLSVGFVVDDAIVVLENIVRHLEMGEKPFEAALNGTREIGFTVISMTLSLVAVFIPILFMGGIIGRLFTEFALTITVAILVSGFVSLTLTPMLCSRFLRAPSSQRHHQLYLLIEAAYESLLRAYEWSLRGVLHRRRAVLASSFVLLAVTGYLFSVVPKGFMPSEDTGGIFGMTEGVQGISFEDMVRHQKALVDIILKNPAVAHTMSTVGASGPSVASNSGRIFIPLKPRGQRKHVDEIIQELRHPLAEVPGIQIFLQNLPSLRVGGQLTKSLYQVTLQGPDTGELYHCTAALADKMRSINGLQDVTTDMQVRNPQVNVMVDRPRASSLGVTAQQVEDALSSAYGARQISVIYAATNEYRVIMELEPQYQRDPELLPMLYIRASSGALIPLSEVAHMRQNVGPLMINHCGQLPSTTISFNLRPGISLGDAVAAVGKTADEIVPDNITVNFQGTAQAFQSSLQNMWLLLVVAMFVIYIVLGMLYESFVHPLTILSGLPSAGLGALITLIIFHVDLNIYSFLGLIMLIGIVKKNAIMMIDFALDAQRTEGKDAREAIYQACLVRFRPIMMTTMSALMGTLPIAIGLGAGSEARQPLGMAVVGGLVVSQLLTLYITPVVYTYLDSFQNKIKRVKRPAVPPAASIEMRTPPH